MAEEKKKKGVFSAFFAQAGKEIGEGITGAISGGLLGCLSTLAKLTGILVVVAGIVSAAIDYIAVRISIKLPEGEVFGQHFDFGFWRPVEESHLLGDYLGFLFGLGLYIGIPLFVVWLILGVLSIVPEGYDKPLWKLILGAVPHLAFRGAKKGGELTAKGVRRGTEELKRRKAASRVCPGCGANRPKGARSCVYCGRQFVAPAPAGGRYLRFQLGRWIWTVRLPGQARSVPVPIQPAPILPPPPETLETGLPVSEAPAIEEDDFPIAPAEDELFKIEEK